MHKREIKYLLPMEMLPKVRDFLMPYMRLDKFAGSKNDPDYTVRSIYFDTRKLKFYHEKKDGLQKRIKVRIRSYNTYSTESIAFLELKRKDGVYIFKNRFPVFVNQLKDVLNGGVFENEVALKSREKDREMFLYQMNSKSLIPVVLVVYEREAYHCKFNPDLRITFDKNVRSVKPQSSISIFEKDNFEMTFRNKFVLELKYNKQFPGWLISMIKNLHLQSCSVSKYALSIDKHLDVDSPVKRLVTTPRLTNFMLN
jgi:SPX domain protein involved in polyphosphate accumulation